MPLLDRDRQTPLLKAIYSVLTAGAPEKAANTMAANIQSQANPEQFVDSRVPIFQAVPKDLPPCFVAISGLDAEDWSTKTNAGSEIKVNFLIVSSYNGQKELANIAHKLLSLLTRQALDLSQDGLRVVLVRPGSQRTAPLEDGRTITRLITFRFLVEDFDQEPIPGG